MSDWIEFDGNAEGFPEGETDGQKLVRLHDLANQLVEANRRDGKPRKIVLKIGHDERQRFRTVGATEDCQQFVCEVAICVEDGAKVSTDQLRDYLEDALCIDIDTEENGTGPEAAGEKATVSVSIVLSTLDTDDPLYNRIPVPSLLKLAPVDLESAVDDLDTRQRDLLGKELEDLIAKAAWVAGYLDHRHGAGCGDQGHADSVKQANKWRKGCRKVMGYQQTHDIQV